MHRTMNFNLLFTTLRDLSFLMTFAVDSGNEQDFFLFSGFNASAHFYRQNSTFNLIIFDNSSYSFYQLKHNNALVSFSWPDISLNGFQMTLKKSYGVTEDLCFDTFTFISPILNFTDQEYNTSSMSIYQLNSVNYFYIALMFLIAGVLFESQTIAVRIFENMKKKYLENDYETMSYLQNKTQV